MYESLVNEHLDLVETLDTESLLDYLVQNGALNTSIVHDIKDTNAGVEINKALIRQLCDGANSHQGLFINALRQTGHLQLANLLETGPRIQPRRWNSLGYLNRTRHKGQVCFILQVNAIEISPEDFPKRRGLSGISYWIWLDDLRPIEVKDNDSVNLQTSISQPHINEKIEKFDVEEKRPNSWCCCCFSRNKRDKMAKYEKAPPALVPVVEEPVKAPPSAVHETMDACDSGLENSESEENFDELKVKADILHKKSSKFYQLLLDLEGKVRNRMLTYFEQKRGILVLDTIFEDGIIIVCISTKMQQLTALQDDFLNGQLVQDLEDSLINEDVKRFIMVKSVKLQLSVDEDEFPKAIRDLEIC